MKYRKKSIVIDAIQYNGVNGYEIISLAHEGLPDIANSIITKGAYCLNIRTLEGDMNCFKLDWIIKGVKGEFYPCKPDIFEATYEAV